MLKQRFHIREVVIKKALHESLYKILKENYGKTLIIYHKSDWDGYTCGAIALMANPNADLLGWNYGDPFPDTTDYNKIILLDVTVYNGNDLTWMINNSDKLIWIDHHANMINNPKLQNIKGVREDGIGACILAWKYFFGGEEIPLHIRLCATYDIFRKDGFYAEWEDAWAYQLALVKLVNIPRNDENSSIVGVNKAIEFIKEQPLKTKKRVEQGLSLEEERKQRENELFKNAEFVQRGSIKICKLVSGPGTPAHNIKTNLDKHTADVFILINPRPLPDGRYKIAIRVPENSNIDASAIAAQYGGNGHNKAAGCAMTMEEFNNI